MSENDMMILRALCVDVRQSGDESSSWAAPIGDREIFAIESALARISDLEAKLERCVRLVVETGTAPNNGTPPDYWVGRGKCYASDYEAEDAIRAAIETPASGERREGDK
jgi:hypothetical protein